MKVKFIVAIATCLFVFRVPLFAHHGNAEFNTQKLLTLQATITDFVWRNPHSTIYFDAKNDKGEVQRWSCESVQPALLHRAGWTRETLKAGDQIMIQLYPAKSGKPIGNLVKVILADGQVLKGNGDVSGNQ